MLCCSMYLSIEKNSLSAKQSVVYFFSQIFWGYGMVLLNQQSNKSIFVSGAMSRKADNKRDWGHLAHPGHETPGIARSLVSVQMFLVCPK